tara:strand:- start:318 stop:584 length:267 start_codon:yes stop_codon:yes gene_type:complete
MYYYIILTIVVLIILFCFHNSSKEKQINEDFTNMNMSSWNVYKQNPLGYSKTGKNPMNYYVKIRYRKPYRFPFIFKKSYPYEHYSFLP